MTPPGSNAVAVLSLLSSGLLWGTTWIPLKWFAEQGLTGLTLTLCTYGLIGIAAAPWIVLRRALWMPRWRAVLAGSLCCGIANASFVSAIMLGEVARTMLLFYLVPVWGVIGGRLFFGEVVTAGRVAAVFMAIAGAVLVLGGPQVLAAPPGAVDLAAIAAGFFYTAQNLFARAAGDVPVMPKTLSAFVGCTVVGAVLIPLAGHRFPAFSPGVVVALVAFAALWLTAAMWTQLYGVSRLEAGRAAVLIVFELLVAIASAMLITGERLDGFGWLGAVLVVGAALLDALSSGKAPPPPLRPTPDEALP